MARNVFLVCLILTTLGGALDARGETALERADAALKEVQAQMEAKKPKEGEAKKGNEADEETTLRRNRVEDYVFRNALSTLRQAREFLTTGNSEGALQVLVQSQTDERLSEEAKASVLAVLELVRKEAAAQEKAFADEVDAARTRAGETVLKANEPKDLDATLQEFSRLTDKSPFARYGGNGSRTAGKLQSAVTFVNRWQDYLLARKRGNDSTLSSSLRSLADGGGEQALLIPRSEILARLPKSEGEGEQANRTPRPTRSQAQGDTEAVGVVVGIKTLDQIPAALAKLATLRQEVTGHRASSLPSDSPLEFSWQELQKLQRNHLELTNGLASSVNLGSARVELTSYPELENTFLPLRAQLVKMAVPRLLGLPDAEKPNDGEALDAYLRRLIEQAKGRQDWTTVVRGLELKRTLASVSTNPYAASNEQEVAAFKSFFAARNLEAAGQFGPAVSAYFEALKSGQQDLPSTVIGERLRAIQTGHPTEYASALERVVNPPFAPSGPGFPNRPGANGPGYDPRAFRPPGPPTPADEKLVVPAAPVPAAPAVAAPGEPSPKPAASPVSK